MTGHSGANTPTSENARKRRGPFGALDERLGVDALRYAVPDHANNLGWSLGGVSVVTFVILLVTGVYLAQFYNPNTESANQSVREISTEVWLGEFSRSLHFWSANAMVLVVFLHLLRVVLHGSYKRPREMNYLVGTAMFALAVAAVFTGTVLKWDQQGFEALQHNIKVAELLGGLGFWFTPEASENLPLLVRLYVAHIMLIPGLIIILLMVHVLLVKQHGISSHPKNTGARSERHEPFTYHVRRVGAFGLILLGVLGVLALLVPPIVGPTPVEGVEVTKPPWMFWWLYTLENWFGQGAILWGSVVFALLVAMLPFVDRGPERSWRKRPIVIGGAALVLVVLIVLSILVFFVEPGQNL
ncbi:cytochrome b N-terminal domain-containing protein [Salininema proteolyticum]|uniref:Cytochrome bc1 complex cytochrome b subunit n=1 Tax=Salininema proteolyticum TaxID=1607685 RepID=A0ABV8U507_9ACTN